jgi:hypothetical protein
MCRRSSRVFLSCFFLSMTLIGSHGWTKTLTKPLPVSAMDASAVLTEQEIVDTLFPKPTPELDDLYRLTGLKHWPLQYVVGHVGYDIPHAPIPKVYVVVYSSLSCDHCADLHLDVITPLLKKYGDRLCVLVRDRPLDLYSLQAAILTYCQPQKAHFLQTKLFQTQEQWMPSFEEMANLTQETAHAKVKKILEQIALGCGYSSLQCQPYLSLTTLKKVAAFISKEAEFKKVLSAPHMYIHAPELYEGHWTYAKTYEIDISEMKFETCDKLIETIINNAES